MKNLKQQLQQQVGLTESQAAEALKLFRNYLIDNSYDPDLVENIKIKAKSKYEKISDKVEDMADDLNNKAEDLADNINEKTEDLIKKARKQAKKVADKLSEYLDD